MNYTSVPQCEVLFSFTACPCVLSKNLVLSLYSRWKLCDCCNFLSCVFCFSCASGGTRGGRVRHMWPEVNKSSGLKVCACDNMFCRRYIRLCVCMTFMCVRARFFFFFFCPAVCRRQLCEFMCLTVAHMWPEVLQSRRRSRSAPSTVWAHRDRAINAQ